MKILITGSSGFIGYHLADELLKRKYDIIGIDNNNNYYPSIIKKKRLKKLKKNKKFRFYKLNLINKKKLEKIFIKHKPDIIFHLAGQPGVLYSIKYPKTYTTNNVYATKSICKISKKHNVKKFIYGSSSSVYGDQEKFPIKENFKLNPKNPYALTKLKSENIVKEEFKKSSTKYIIFRFFTVYGPFGRPDMFIHKFLNSIKKNKKIKLYNNGLNFRDFTYIKDVVKILSKIIKVFPVSRVINICRSKPIKTTHLVSLIKKFYRENYQFTNTGFVKGEMLKTHGSNKLLKKNFKNIKFTDIKIGLKKTILAFKKYGY